MFCKTTGFFKIIYIDVCAFIYIEVMCNVRINFMKEVWTPNNKINATNIIVKQFIYSCSCFTFKNLKFIRINCKSKNINKFLCFF